MNFNLEHVCDVYGHLWPFGQLQLSIPPNFQNLLPKRVCLGQVRAEQAQLRPDTDATITGAVLNEMVYTRQVVKEVLRFRPPAPMVPQVQIPPFPALSHGRPGSSSAAGRPAGQERPELCRDCLFEVRF